MNFNLLRTNVRLCAIAPALAALSACPLLVHAESVVSIPMTVVTGSRIPETLSSAPYALKVITLDEIKEAGLSSANEALRVLAGISSSINTAGGRDQILDIRGFGESASSNIAVLVDGIRQNEGDSKGVDLSWIPLESIERIELLRGSGAVLYGEGATGGVIHVITNKNVGASSGTIALGVGSLGRREGRFVKRFESQNWVHSIAGNRFLSDGHRENFATEEASLNWATNWDDGATRLGALIASQATNTGLPGGLNLDDFQTRPTHTYTPNDRGEGTLDSLTLSAETDLGAAWRAAVDISRRVRAVSANYVASGYTTDSHNRTTRLGGRLWWEGELLGVPQTVTVGLDQERWTEDRLGPFISQRSDAIYARQAIEISQAWTAFGGARRTVIERNAWGTTAGLLTASENSWELGGSYVGVPEHKTFARVGSSLRLAKADEFICYVQWGCGLLVNALLPQTSNDIEVGHEWAMSGQKNELRIYRSEITNEIGLDASYVNVNYDPTLRQGIEYEVSGDLSPRFNWGAGLTLREAKFRSGAATGNDIPVVSSKLANLRVGLRISEEQRLTFNAQVQSSQRISGDVANACDARIPGYVVAGLVYTHQVRGWTLQARSDNLFDRKYYNYRSRCDSTAKSIYPEAQRTFFINVERKF